MDRVKYTLDRIDDGQYVFLQHTNEEKQLLIPENEVTSGIAEGDIVLISKENSNYKFELLNEETDDMKNKVSSLLEKLKNKK